MKNKGAAPFALRAQAFRAAVGNKRIRPLLYNMQNIEIFTGPNCAYCEQAKALMRLKGFEFVEKNIAEPGMIEDFRQRLPRSKALPQIFIDGRHIGSLEDLQLRLRQ